jgi:hypothetical protein
LVVVVVVIVVRFGIVVVVVAVVAVVVVVVVVSFVVGVVAMVVIVVVVVRGCRGRRGRGRARRRGSGPGLVEEVVEAVGRDHLSWIRSEIMYPFGYASEMQDVRCQCARNHILFRNHVQQHIRNYKTAGSPQIHQRKHHEGSLVGECQQWTSKHS